MSVASLQETALLEVIERADADAIVRYKKAIADREQALANQAWHAAMADTVDELRVNPNFANHRELVDTMRLNTYGRQTLFVDTTANVTYCFWYGSNKGRELRMSTGANRHTSETLLELNARRFTCSGDVRAFPSKVIAFAYALLAADVEAMLEKNHKKHQVIG